MSSFYRYTAPSYFLGGGSFPGTIGAQAYGLANVVSGGVGGGDGSAVVYGPVSSGSNVGSLLVAFGEDATSGAVNRGLVAALSNTDVLDTLLRSSITRPATAVVTLDSPSLDIQLPADAFVGAHATVDTQAVRSALFHVEKVDGTPVLDASGDQAALVLVHDGAGTSVIGVPAGGFRTQVYLRYNVLLPAGSYNVYYSQRTSVADIVEAHVGALTDGYASRRHMELDLWKLSTHGLNELYRKSTHGVPAAFNTPGAGAKLTRDGAAVTLFTPPKDWLAAAAATDDPLCASLAISSLADPLAAQPQTGQSKAYGGFVGLVDYQSVVTGTPGGAHAASARTSQGEALATVVVGTPVDLGADVPTNYTYLGARSPAVLNPAGAGAAQVKVTGAHRFATGGATALTLGVDLLALTWVTTAGATVTVPFLVTSIVNDTTVVVGTTGGVSPSFAANTAATVSWVSVTGVLGGVGHAKDAAPYGSSYAAVMAISPARASLSSVPADRAGLGWVGSGLFGCAPDAPRERTQVHGYHDPATGRLVETVEVYPNGRVVGTAGYMSSVLAHRQQSITLNGGPATATVDVISGGGLLCVEDTRGSTADVTLTLVEGEVLAGALLKVVLLRPAGVTGLTGVTRLVWPSSWRMGSSDTQTVHWDEASARSAAVVFDVTYVRGPSSPLALVARSEF